MASTFVVSVRTSVENIATIAMFLAQNKQPFRNRSDAALFAVNYVAEKLREQNPGLNFSLPESVEILQHLGISLFEKNRGVKELHKQLGNIEIRDYEKSTTRHISPEEAEAVKLYEEMSKGNSPSAKPQKRFGDILVREEDSEAKVRRDRELQELISSFSDAGGVDVAED